MTLFFRRKTVMILALVVSLALTLIVMALDDNLRERLGTSYWLLGLAIIGSILLVLAGYVWDQTLLARVKAIHQTAQQQSLPLGLATETAIAQDSDEIVSLARQIERMAQAVQCIEGSYRAVVEDQLDLICRYRGDGALTFVNGAMQRFFGTSRDQLLGTRAPMFALGYPPRDATARLPENATFETELTDAAGQVRKFAWTHRAIKSQAGSTMEYQAVGHDITLRCEAEAALVRATEAAEAAERSKTLFLDLINRGLDAPVREVVESAARLRNGAASPDAPVTHDDLYERSQRLQQVMTDVRELWLLESRQIRVQPQLFRLAEHLADVAAGFEEAARAAGVELVCQVEPNVPRLINTDSRHLRRILRELVADALARTHSGRITLSATGIRGDELPGGQNRRLRLFIAVAASDCGRPSEQLANVFQPFAEVANLAPGSWSRRSGLGLAIAKRLVELMEGAVSVESRVGEGTTFRFSLACDYPRTDTRPPMLIQKADLVARVS
jgi:PAS domain S-box-containing protein